MKSQISTNEAKLKPPPRCNRNMNVERDELLKNEQARVNNRTSVSISHSVYLPSTENARKAIGHETHLSSPKDQDTQVKAKVQSINSTWAATLAVDSLVIGHVDLIAEEGGVQGTRGSDLV